MPMGKFGCVTTKKVCMGCFALSVLNSCERTQGPERDSLPPDNDTTLDHPTVCMHPLHPLSLSRANFTQMPAAYKHVLAITATITVHIGL